MNRTETNNMTTPEKTKKGIEPDTWGVIYCPIEGGRRNWPKIRQYLDKKGVKYDFVQSEGPGSVERLSAMFTRSGYRTIVVVGSDSALNHALNGVMKTPSPHDELPTIGIIPNGLVNDFARYWEFDSKDYKANIDRLVLNKTRRIDVGVAVGVLSGEEADNTTEPTQYFLNCLNIGAVASIVNIKRETQRFFVLSLLSYVISAFILLFKRMSFNIDFTTAGEHVSRRAMTICVGSAHGYGQTPSAVPYNGQLDISLVTAPQLTQLFHGLWLLFTHRFLSHKGISVWRTKEIEFHSLGHAPVSLDGRMMPRKVQNIKVTILPEAINFLI